MTKAEDAVYEQLAAQWGVTPAYMKRYMARFPGPAPGIEEMVTQLEVETNAQVPHTIGLEGETPKEIEDEARQRAVRSLQGKAGAHRSWAQTQDRSARTRPAREAFDKRFEREVDPDGTLDPAERARRAKHARKAYFYGMALKSAKVRRERRGK